jgi:hypothetical protein
LPLPTNRKPLVRKPSSGGPPITDTMVEIFERMLALGPADTEAWYRELTLLDAEIVPRPKPWIIPLAPHWSAPWQDYQIDLAGRLHAALAARKAERARARAAKAWAAKAAREQRAAAKAASEKMPPEGQ